MKIAHDLYAERNPAFGTYAVAAFVHAFAETEPQGADLPIVYVALPIALSGELALTFEGTNKTTGLLEWLGRTPQMSVGFADRVNAGLPTVGDAVRYGCFTHVLRLSPEGRLGPGPKKPKQSPLTDLDAVTLGVIRRAGRLGHWFASAGSTRNIFGILGLTV
jgi:hypothetical protein